jgi:hypothetical protein
MDKSDKGFNFEVLSAKLQLESELIAELLTNEIQSKVKERRVFEKIADTSPIPMHSGKAMWKLPKEKHCQVHIMSSLGHVMSDTLRTIMEHKKEAGVVIFQVQSAQDWPNYAEKEKQLEAIDNAIEAVVQSIAEYEEEAAWRTILPVVTSESPESYDEVLPTIPPQIYEMPTADPTAGYFSKELLNRMIVGAQRYGKRLCQFLVSPEDLADIREYTNDDIDPVTRREIFTAGGCGSIWGISLECSHSLGIRGLYNINGNESSWGRFVANSEENFLSYKVVHPNVVDKHGNLVKPGETQFYAFTEDISDYFKMPINTPYIAFWDMALHRRQRCGFFGWQHMGSAIYGSKSIYMGVVDRSFEDIMVDESGYMKIKPKRRKMLLTHR